jgi:short subunit dehydrogenase-like uncharacterized protein
MKTDRSGAWLIYGANGYTGELIAREAKKRGMTPILAGRSEQSIAALAGELGLEHRVFGLEHASGLRHGLAEVDLVLHCAGPFSATAGPMMRACLLTRTHYLDITGEIAVFERAIAHDQEARAAGVVVCPGVGFDVVPTDCVAATLKEALPAAIRLTLGYDSTSGLSPGTAKTVVEGLPQGGSIRRDGIITKVPLAHKTRRINFGNGEKLAMTIRWGDVATAFRSTGIPNIEVYVPASPRLVSRLRKINLVRSLLGIGMVQSFIKRRIEKTVTGPNAEQRGNAHMYVWGEVETLTGERRTARIRTANGYDVTVTASLGITDILLAGTELAGYATPSMIAGKDFVKTLPGSSEMTIE